MTNDHSLLPTPPIPKFDDSRMLDVSDGAVIFAEQSQINNDQFVTATFVKIDHSPAQRKSFAVIRQRVRPRLARRVNPWAERDVAHQNLIGLRDQESRMANRFVNGRRFDDVFEKPRRFAFQIKIELQRSERIADGKARDRRGTQMAFAKLIPGRIKLGG